MILIGDISREVPNLIDRMIENGIFNSILNRLKQKIPNDADTIPMIIYFLNMFCMVENGKKLEDEFNILEKIFETLMDNDFVETLYSGNKGSSNIGKCVASIV
jgi:hypothetical protein